jgi:antitoxin VapB
MSQTAKLFKNGRSQAVRLPAAFRFDGDEVYIRRDPTTGDVILSAKPRSFDRFFAVLAEGKAPDDFLSPGERRPEGTDRDPFEGWEE